MSRKLPVSTSSSQRIIEVGFNMGDNHYGPVLVLSFLTGGPNSTAGGVSDASAAVQPCFHFSTNNPRNAPPY